MQVICQLAVLITLILGCSATLDDIYTRFPEDVNVSWIWGKDTGSPNQWTAFRKEFIVDELEDHYEAYISVDSKYWLWINGEMVVFEGQLKRGPNPTDGFYDTVDISKYIKVGKNVFALQAWYFGRNGFSHMSSGSAGLLVYIPNLKLQSDDTWKCMRLEAYQPEIIQAGYRLPDPNVVYNATLEILDWQKTDFDTTSWSTASVICQYPCEPFNILWNRPFPLFKYSDIIKKTGDDIKMIGTKTVETIASEYKVTVSSEYNIYQLRLPVNVHFSPFIHIKAPQANEYIFMDPDTKYVGNEMTHYVTYITKEGEQTFELLDWINGQYIQFVMPKDITIIELGWRESGYDSEFIGSFECNDDYYNKLWMKSRHTLYVTIRDNYMDCPDRERTYWTGDQVNEALMSYYVFDERIYDAVRKGILLVEDWHNSDGVIPTIAPSKDWFELPDQSLAGIIGSYHYYYYRNDLSVFKHIYPISKNYVLNSFSMNENGLLNYRPGSWDWADWGENIDTVMIQNIWYYMTMNVMVKMATALNITEDIQFYQSRADSIQSVFIKTFWNEEKQAFYSPGYTGDIDDRANAMVVIANLVDASYYPAIIHVLQSHTYASPYMEKYVEEAFYLMNVPDMALSRMKARYQEMVDYDYTTLWELWDINSGTKNHAWSGGPLYLLSRYTAGVYPTSLGYESYAIRPQLGSLTSVHVVVPTIKGLISVNITTTSSSTTMNVQGLNSITGTISIPKMNKDSSVLSINSSTLNIATCSQEEISEFEQKTHSHYISNSDDYVTIEVATNNTYLITLY